MYPYIQIILPSYAVMAFLGGITALLFVYFRLERYQISFSEFLRLFLISVAGGFIGSKVLFILTKVPALLHNFSIGNGIRLIVESGFVFYGGLFGVLLALHLYSGRDLKKQRDLFALVTPAIPLFHSFGRIGCLLAGCCYGKTLEHPVTVAGFVKFYKIPVALIEAIFEAVLFFILICLERRNCRYNLLKVYLVTYAFFRFWNEFMRGDEARGIFANFSTAQWISMGILLICSFQMIRGKKKTDGIVT